MLDHILPACPRKEIVLVPHALSWISCNSAFNELRWRRDDRLHAVQADSEPGQVMESTSPPA